jgi:hypothetical protein
MLNVQIRPCSSFRRELHHLFMKMFSKPLLGALVVAALASLFLPHSALSAQAGSGQLRLKRSAHFGANLFLDVWIDGKKVQRLGRGHDYTGSLSPGRHEIRAEVSKRLGGNTATTNLMVEAGKSYLLTATWNGQQLTLK